MNIDNFISQYKNGDVEVSDGVSYSLREVIENNYRLYNSKFATQQVESSGFNRIFYNIIWIIYRSIIMASDVDLKDMNMRSTNQKQQMLVAFIKMATKSHLMRTFFGKYIDKVMSEMVWHGTSITKRVYGQVETVDLRNIVRPPQIKDIQESGLAELVYYSWDDMLTHKEEFKEQWSEIKAHWEVLQKEGVSRFTIIEWWTFGQIGDDKKTHKICKKYLDRTIEDPEDYKDVDDWDAYLLLDEFITPYKKKRVSKDKEQLGDEEMFPYEQADLFDVPGRWLAFGCAELLEGINEHYNEKWNLYRKKDILDLKGIIKHKYTANSNSLTQEFLNDLETGSVLSMDVEEDLERLIIDTKTGEFIASIDKLYEVARLIMGVTAQGTGEELPASTTATVAVANQRMQQTTYDYVREQIHHFVVRLFTNGYFEDIINELDEKEAIAIVGDPTELSVLDEFLIDEAVNAEWERIKNETGEYPGDEEEYKAIKEQMKDEMEKDGDMRFLQVKKQILAQADFFIEFFMVNETFDKNTKIQNLLAMKSDPNSQLSKQALDNTILDLIDENPNQYRKSEDEKAAEVEAIRQQQMAETQAVQAPQPITDSFNQPNPLA